MARSDRCSLSTTSTCEGDAGRSSASWAPNGSGKSTLVRLIATLFIPELATSSTTTYIGTLSVSSSVSVAWTASAPSTTPSTPTISYLRPAWSADWASNTAWSTTSARSIVPSAMMPPYCTGASKSTRRRFTPSMVVTPASWKTNPKPTSLTCWKLKNSCANSSAPTLSAFNRSPPCPTASAAPVRLLTSLACSFSARPQQLSASVPG